jgi:phage shock protein A
MEAEALETTGIGIEKLGWNPVIRMLKSPNPFIRAIAPQLVSVGGMIQKKVAMGREMSQSVEDTFSTTYVSELVNSMRAMDTEYLAYRGITASKSDVKRSAQLFGLKAKDLVNRNRSYLTETDFRTRVSRAMRNGDVDDINDLATPKVNAAAHKARKLLNIIKKNAEDVDLFGKAIGKKIKALKTKLSKATSQATIAKIEREIMEAQQELQTLRTTGATPNTAISYLPRIWRVDKLMDNQEHFMKVVSRWAMSANSLDQTAAQNFAREMFDTVTRSRPYMMLDEVSDEIDFITQASGSKLRNFKIPDKLIEEFLENDIEVLLRHHTRTMGMDIELTRRFGDISMEDNIKFIVDDYKKLIKETSDPIKRRSLKESMESDIKDLRGLRDRIRGTYGASKDPHRLSSRFVRGMKSFNVIVGMGGAVLSSIPDVARSIMVEGMDNFYRHGLTDLFNTLPQRLANMKRRELDAATVSADAQLGLRAMSMNDVGDTFGSRFTWERKLNQSTGVFFMLNGLNWWNQTLKEFSGGIIMFRMTDSIMSPWNSLSKTDKRKLLASGISEQDAGRMKALIRQHGHQESGKWYPNTDFWNAVGDDYLVRKFRNALHGSVNRTIVTPGAGDRALWTSTEMGSLMTQFKGYGQAAMVRVLTSGLQEKDSAFWQGAIIMVTMGALVNELKKIQYGIEGEESYDEKLINAIDRSGILGWFTDVNNSLEKISDYKFGARPMFTDEGPMPIPASAKLGAIFGPASSNLATGGSVMSSILRSEFDQNSADSLRFITPGGNLPYLDPIYDGVFNQ